MTSEDFGQEAVDEAEKERLAAEREKRIRSEATRLRKMLRDGGIDEGRLKGVASIVDRAAFLHITCADLQDEINRDGCTDHYQNGAMQWGTKQSPAVQTLSVFAQRHLAAMKQLVDMLPVDEAKSKSGDKLLDHISR